jgi:hypothetical protein
MHGPEHPGITCYVRRSMAKFYINDCPTTGCVTHQCILHSCPLIKRFILMQTMHLESCHLFLPRPTPYSHIISNHKLSTLTTLDPHPACPYFHCSRLHAGCMRLLVPCEYRTASLGCQPTIESKRPRPITGLPLACRRVSGQISILMFARKHVP